KLGGAILIPEFHLFRAHHNKAFQEILRDLSSEKELQSLRSRAYGCYEEFEKDLDALSYPVVIKPSAGDSARGVALARGRREAVRLTRRVSRTLSPAGVWKSVSRKAFTKGWRSDSLHRQKFIVQEFVPDLDHDWKVLVFGSRYFVRVRPTRKGDFRASGVTGKRTFPRDLPGGLLDFVERVFRSFGAPHASVDVLHDGSRFHLGEIQFVRFGTGPLIHSPHHFRRSADGWERVDGTCEWEQELARSIAEHIETGGSAGTSD
ncbi:MAG: hypothetical protein JRG91_20565, partial [Deltaproteobacteria bacterium]|nr:hypothetical protein [Deltaproteobacteria bacterium]